MREGYVYILSNKNRTTLYVGVTNDLERRVLEHKSGHGSKFTSKYKLYSLIYYEYDGDVASAIEREKQLKNWHSDWKWNLVKEENQDLIDLAIDWFSKEEIEDFREMMNQVNNQT